MAKCLIIVNDNSGKSGHVRDEELAAYFGGAFQTQILHVRGEDDYERESDIARYVFCGGDGTLYRAMNEYRDTDAQLFYCPYGTWNERSKVRGAGKDSFALKYVGDMNGSLYSYVSATGIFTPLGYAVTAGAKKRSGILAYIAQVFKQYRVCSISADIRTDDREYSGDYALVMAIMSKRCFGLSFNRMYRFSSPEFHLLTIRSTGRDSVWHRAKLFFPLFRAFFVGFSREYHGKYVDFVRCTRATVDTRQPQVFCVDGERVEAPRHIEWSVAELTPNVTIVPRRVIRHSMRGRHRG